jgi:hypothetical protein
MTGPDRAVTVHVIGAGPDDSVAGAGSDDSVARTTTPWRPTTIGTSEQRGSAR